MGRLKKVFVAGLLPVFAVAVYVIAAYSDSVIIDNVVRIGKATELYSHEVETYNIQLGNPGTPFWASARAENTYWVDFSGKFKLRVYVPDPVPQLENDYTQYDPTIYKHASIYHTRRRDGSYRRSGWSALDQNDWNRSAAWGPAPWADKWWHIVINKEVDWKEVEHADEPKKATIVGNADYVWLCPSGNGGPYLPGDYYTNAAESRRLESPVFEIEAGQYFRIIPGERKYVWGDNAGGTTFEIVRIVDYIKVFPYPACVLPEKQIEFVVKGYQYGENGVRDRDPDPITYEPAGDDLGPIDMEIDATWSLETTQVAPEAPEGTEIGTLSDATPEDDTITGSSITFTAGKYWGTGKVKATSGDLSDEVDITVLDIEYFLIRDAWNYWNLIQHFPGLPSDLRSVGEYWDHQKKLTGDQEEIIVAADNQTDSAQVRLEIATIPAGLEDKISWWAPDDQFDTPSSQVDPASGSFDRDGRAMVTVASAGTGGQETYEIYVGVDSNQDGMLDLDKEARSVNRVRFLTKAHLLSNYRDMVAEFFAADLLGDNVTATLGYIFLGFPEGVEPPVPSTTKPSTIYRMDVDHPVGALFSPSTGEAPLDERKFTPDSEVADKIEVSPELEDIIKSVLAKPENKNEMLDFFANDKKISYHPFDFSEESVRMTFQSGDLGTSLLGCYISPLELQVHVRRGKNGELSIEKLTASGEVTDIYDWNFYDLGRHQKLATIQFAWVSPPGEANAGQIFRIRIKFKAKFDEFPFP